MDQELNYLNSEEAARILGVNVSSIKRWTDQGWLECIQTAGGHRKFLMSHLAHFLAQNEKKASKANVFDVSSEKDLEISFLILKRGLSQLEELLLQKARQCERDEVFRILSGLYLSQYPLYHIYDNLITPVLHRVGNAWFEKGFSIIEEHITTHTLREGVSRLQGIIHIPQEKTEKVLCLNLSTEMHDFALQLVENILEFRGFYTYLSGQMTPLMQIEKIIQEIKPDRIYISSTYVMNHELAQSEVNFLFSLAESTGIRVFIGGQGWDVLKHDHQVVEQRLDTFEEVYLM
jgi:methanogenic corrinoid protein MtbC1